MDDDADVVNGVPKFCELMFHEQDPFSVIMCIVCIVIRHDCQHLTYCVYDVNDLIWKSSAINLPNDCKFS